MTRITVACLDMAGTTVADDGTVDGGVYRRDHRTEPVRDCLPAGHDRREVDHGPVQDRGIPADPGRGGGRAEGQRGVRGSLRHGGPQRPDRGAARRRGHDHAAARRRGPGLPGHRVLPRHQGRHHRRACLGRPDRPGPVPCRRRPRPPLARPAADRAAEAARRCRQRTRRRRRHPERRGVRAARRGRDRRWRADRRRLPGRPGTGRAPRSSWTRSRASCPTSRSYRPAGGDKHRLGRQRHRDRRARGQGGGFRAGLIDLDGDVA